MHNSTDVENPNSCWQFNIYKHENEFEEETFEISFLIEWSMNKVL